MLKNKKNFWYIFFIVLAAIFGVLKFIFFSSILLPKSFGLYSLVLTSYVFVTYAGSLGLNEAMIKLGSLAHGKCDDNLKNELRDVAIVYGGIFISIFGLFFLLGVYLFITNEQTAQALNFTAVLAVSAFWFNIIDSYFRVNQQIVVFAVMLSLKSFLVLIAGYYLASVYGVIGVVIAEFLTFLILFIVFIYYSAQPFLFFRAVKNTALLKRAILNGFPMLLSTFIGKITLMMDRWVIAASLGLAALGQYAFLMILYLIAVSGIGIVTNVMGPTWLSVFGQNNDIGQLFKDIRKTVLVILSLALVFMWPFLAFFQFIVEVYYLQYMGSDLLLSAQFIYLGVCLLIPAYLLNWFFIATSNERFLVDISSWTFVITLVLLMSAYIANVDVVVYAFIFALVRLISVALYARRISILLRLEL
jgi:O-antigen/teichoic acid export membrane protein